MSGTVRRKLGPLTLDVPAIIIGLQILLKGIDKLEGFGHHPVVVTALLALGGFILVAAFLPLWLEKRVAHAHAIFHLAEGVAMSLSALILFEKGKLRIPVILICVGILYVLVSYMESRPKAQQQKLAGPMLRGVGGAFLAGSLVLAVYTAMHDRDVFAFGAAGLFAIIGGAMLLGLPRALRLRAASEAPEAQASETGNPAH